MKKKLQKLVRKALKGIKYPKYADFKEVSSINASYIYDELLDAPEELQKYALNNYPNIDNSCCPKSANEELENLFSI